MRAGLPLRLPPGPSCRDGWQLSRPASHPSRRRTLPRVCPSRRPPRLGSPNRLPRSGREGPTSGPRSAWSGNRRPTSRPRSAWSGTRRPTSGPRPLWSGDRRPTSRPRWVWSGTGGRPRDPGGRGVATGGRSCDPGRRGVATGARAEGAGSRSDRSAVRPGCPGAGGGNPHAAGSSGRASALATTGGGASDTAGVRVDRPTRSPASRHHGGRFGGAGHLPSSSPSYLPPLPPPLPPRRPAAQAPPARAPPRPHQSPPSGCRHGSRSSNRSPARHGRSRRAPRRPGPGRARWTRWHPSGRDVAAPAETIHHHPAPLPEAWPAPLPPTPEAEADAFGTGLLGGSRGEPAPDPGTSGPETPLAERAWPWERETAPAISPVRAPGLPGWRLRPPSPRVTRPPRPPRPAARAGLGPARARARWASTHPGNGRGLHAGSEVPDGAGGRTDAASRTGRPPIRPSGR